MNLLIDQIILPWKLSLAQQASRKLDWLKDTVCTIHEGNLENEERRFYLENSFYIYIFFDFQIILFLN